MSPVQAGCAGSGYPSFTALDVDGRHVKKARHRNHGVHRWWSPVVTGEITARSDIMTGANINKALGRSVRQRTSAETAADGNGRCKQLHVHVTVAVGHGYKGTYNGW
ncbi:unnamed protein product [Lota lota]